MSRLSCSARTPSARRLLALIALAFLLLPARPAGSCLHGPEGMGPVLQDGGRMALVLWNDGVEALTLEVSYRSAPLNQGDKIREIAWVVPVPQEPIEYALAEKQLFDQLGSRARVVRRTSVTDWVLSMLNLRAIAGYFKSSATSLDVGTPGALELGETRKIGEYEIQPIRGIGPQPVAALQAWFKEKHLAAIPNDNLQQYVDLGWTFVTVRVWDPQALADTGQLTPLTLVFRTSEPVIPVRLAGADDRFRMTVFSVTHKDVRRADLARLRWQTPEMSASDLELKDPNLSRSDCPPALAGLMESLAPKSSELAALFAGPMRLGHFWSEELTGKEWSALPEDPHFRADGDFMDHWRHSPGSRKRTMHAVLLLAALAGLALLWRHDLPATLSAGARLACGLAFALTAGLAVTAACVSLNDSGCGLFLLVPALICGVQAGRPAVSFLRTNLAGAPINRQALLALLLGICALAATYAVCSFIHTSEVTAWEYRSGPQKPR